MQAEKRLNAVENHAVDAQTDKTSDIKQQKKTNYYFLLACMGALTCSVLTAVVYMIFAAAAKAAALATIAVAATLAVAATFNPFIPIAGVVALALGAICLLPFLIAGCFSARTSNYHAHSSCATVSSYPGTTFYSAAPVTYHGHTGSRWPNYGSTVHQHVPQSYPSHQGNQHSHQQGHQHGHRHGHF